MPFSQRLPLKENEIKSRRKQALMEKIDAFPAEHSSRLQVKREISCPASVIKSITGKEGDFLYHNSNQEGKRNNGNLPVLRLRSRWQQLKREINHSCLAFREIFPGYSCTVLYPSWPKRCWYEPTRSGLTFPRWRFPNIVRRTRTNLPSTVAQCHPWTWDFSVEDYHDRNRVRETHISQPVKWAVIWQVSLLNVQPNVSKFGTRS